MDAVGVAEYGRLNVGLRAPLRLSCGSHDAPAGGHFDPLQTRTAGTGFWCSHLYTSA